MGAVLANDGARVHASDPIGNEWRLAAFAYQTANPPPAHRRPIMDKNRIDGAAKEIKGATKEALGKVTGNTGKQMAGSVEKNVGTAQRKMGEAADKTRQEAKR